MATLLKIPGPTPLPLLGNALSMDQSYPLGSLEKFADEYGQSAGEKGSKPHEC